MNAQMARELKAQPTLVTKLPKGLQSILDEGLVVREELLILKYYEERLESSLSQHLLGGLVDHTRDMVRAGSINDLHIEDFSTTHCLAVAITFALEYFSLAKDYELGNQICVLISTAETPELGTRFVAYQFRGGDKYIGDLEEFDEEGILEIDAEGLHELLGNKFVESKG